jgi:hypothetical protein
MVAATKLSAHVSGAHTTIRPALSAASDTFGNPDLFATIAVAAIGLLLTLALARLYPLGDALILLGQSS